MTTAEISQPTQRRLPHLRSPLRNPVVLKELRSRMRGKRAFVVITFYLSLLSGFATLLYLLYTSSLSLSGSAETGQIGRVLFMGIVGLELLLVTFIAPAFTSGAISGERERQTYDLLRTTLLPARSLVIGKLISALSYIFLLLLAAIPLQSIAFLFGGVTETEIILAFIILIVTGIALGTVGIYFSAVTQRTLTANVMTNAFALLITVGLPLILAVVGSVLAPLLYGFGGLAVSPVWQAILVYGGGLLISTNPIATAGVTQALLIDRQEAGFFTIPLTGNFGTVNLPVVSPWVVFVVLYLAGSLVLLALAIRRVRRVDK